jgi:hypothetical protein
MSCKFVVGRILFRCDPTLISGRIGVDLLPRWFEVVDGETYLVLFALPGQYTSAWEKDEDRSQYRDLTTGQFAPIVMGRYGFEVDAAQLDLRYVDFLREISVNCTSPDLTTHTPLKVLDFARPHSRDKILIGDQYCTVRVGRITDIKESTGSIQLRGIPYGSSFKVSFQEKKKRRYIG